MENEMRTYYHLGSPYRRESIYRNGLKPRTKTTGTIKFRNKLFLFSDLNEMPWGVVCGEVRDLWEVKIPDRVKVMTDEIALSDGHGSSWMTGWHVPPENLRYLASLPHPNEYQYWDEERLVIVRFDGVEIFPLEPAEPGMMKKRR